MHILPPPTHVPQFPTAGLLPKETTEAAVFLKKYPSYDGRDTVIAILDTGVDPGAAGMGITSHGKPKIIDLIDCTGSGDVLCTTKAKSEIVVRDGQKIPSFKGLSGRTLLLNPTWKPADGEFRLGLKRAYELYPKPLVTRLQKERRDQFEVDHHKLVTAVQQQLADWDKKYPNPSNAPEDDLRARADLEARRDELKNLYKIYDDPGPMMDCVVFKDGDNWRAVVDVGESGDLRELPALTDYKKELKYHTFSEQDLLNYSVNIYDDGDTLSIVTLAGSHGTHVAAITAANFPEEPDLNGVAPGAQIVSLKVGDTRLGSMETGLGLVRAVVAMAEHNVHLANMSYGEAGDVPNAGRFIELLRDEVVGRFGTIFVSSAGNAGPALSTVGSPGGTTTGVIGVGAHVGFQQIQAEYALVDNVPERPYTWSSRGPSSDGDIGVTIFAPGSAITSVPQYSLQKNQLMNGTSMSSPNLCGCLSVILSGLLAEKKTFTPYRINNALVNSAKCINDPFGVGFVQVDKMWDYIHKHYDRRDQDILFKTIVRPGNNRGIYIREYDDSERAHDFSVTVDPIFMRDLDQVSVGSKNNMNKFEFETRLVLVCTQPWIRAPDFLLLNNGGRTFDIHVDPTGLSAGEFYYGEVQAFESLCVERGPIFKVPVTVTKPAPASANGLVRFEKLVFFPGDIKRKFVKVPDGANFADVSVSASNDMPTSPARFLVHFLQVVPDVRFPASERKYAFTLNKGNYSEGSGDEQIERKRFSVYGGRTMEVCMAQFWSALGSHTVSVELAFHGLRLGGSVACTREIVYLNANDGVTRFDLTSMVRREEAVEPKILFDMVQKHLRPADFTLAPMGDHRNVLPDLRRIHALLLKYNYKNADANVTIIPLMPIFKDVLYPSFVLGYFYTVYDINKQVIGSGDVYAHSHKLEHKGDYTIHVRICHDDLSVLEKLTSSILCVRQSLPSGKNVTLESYKSRSSVLTAKKPDFGKAALNRGDLMPVFFGSPDIKDVKAVPGDVLLGELTFGGITKVEGGLYTIGAMVSPESKTKEMPLPPGDKPPEKSEDEQVEEAIRDARLSLLPKLKTDAAQDRLLVELDKSHGRHLPFLQQHLDILADKATAQEDGTAKGDPFTLPVASASEVLKAADRLLAAVDRAELVTYYAGKQDIGTESAKANKKDMEKRRDALVAALLRKVQALASMIPTAEAEAATKLSNDLKSTWTEYQKWNPSENSTSSALAYATKERLAGRYGNALKTVNKCLSEVTVDGGDKGKEVQKVWKMRGALLQGLGWDCWTNYDATWNLVRYPSAYADF